MTKMNTTRPNILMVITHDLGTHLHCYGNKTVQSPNLDKLAAEGVIFTNYFAAAPECTPSRAGLYTGLYTHQNGLMGLVHRGWEFNPDAKHLAQYLHESGYQTHLFGFQHETHNNPVRLGYDNIHSQQDMKSRSVCPKVCEFLQSDAARSNQPWFVNAGLIDVHRSGQWKKHTEFDPDKIDVPPFLPDNQQVREDLASFHQEIKDMDANVGTVLETLQKQGLSENTIVIFTTDHGMPFPRAKSTLYDPGIRTALIIRGPKSFVSNANCDQQLINLDFCPTILEAANAELPRNIYGRSFLPILTGKEYQPREHIFGCQYYDAFYDPMHFIRTTQCKYIRSFAVTEKDRTGIPAEAFAKHKTGTWIRADDSDVQRSPSWLSIKRQYPPPPQEELYDLQNDPDELNNVAEHPQYQLVLKDMRSRLNSEMQNTQSPMLKGHISPLNSISENMRINEWLNKRLK